MSDYKDIFQTKASQVFCKAWTAVHITRDGLVDFVDKEFHTFHNSILPTGFNCMLCTTEHVLESNRLLPCQDHGHIRDAIHQEHRFSKPRPNFSGPSWRNTKPENWTTSSWDVAKCFMPIGGYLEKATAAETDFNGIIGAVINSKSFEKLFTADLSQKNNICTEVRNKVNEIRHFKNLEPGITDADLNDNIDLFIDLLNDTKALQGDLKATDARDKLNKLKLDTLVITTEEAGKILEDALNEFKKFHTAMESTKQDALKEIEDMLDDAHKRLTDIGAEQEKKLSDAGTEQILLIKEAGGEEVGTAKKELGAEKDKLVTVIQDEGSTKVAKVTNQANVECDRIREAGGKSLQVIQDEGKTNVAKVTDQANVECVRIQDAGDKALQDIELVLEAASSKFRSDIKTEAGALCLDVEQQIKKQGNTKIKDIQDEGNTNVAKVTDQANAECDRIREAGNKTLQATCIKTQEKNTTYQKNYMYEEKKNELRHALAQHYWTKHDSMSLSPLMPEIDDKLIKFNTAPKMNKMDIKSSTKSVQTQDIVDTYKALFYDDNNPHRNIYIQGEAGIGKTTFCTKLGLVWSEKYLPECSKNSINESTIKSKQIEEIFSDENIMNEFDFVFSLALRNVEGECEIQKMIWTQIISELTDDENKYAGLVTEILDKERCLIILDGLDEWSHQRNCKKSPRLLVPHRKLWRKTTVLTSTRPWKMCLRDSEISVLIKITGLTDTRTFAENVLNCLNDKYNKTLDVKDFLRYMRDKKLEHFLDIPVVAMQLLLLWHSGHELGDSKRNIYMNMLGMLFGRAQEKPQSGCDDTADIPKAGLPSCFESKEFCEQHKMLLDCLGSLAFHTLHSSEREESLVFSESIMKSRVKSTTACKTALTTGILTQHKSPSRNKRTTHFSFLHKTFQEFLAAYYITTNVDESENILQTLFQVYGQTVDIMDISELFIFVCGLNTEMSCKISDSVMKSFSDKLTNHIEELPVSGDDYNVSGMTESLQKMILAGYKEGISNGHQDPQLALHHVYYSDRNISGDDKIYRDRLVDRNIDKIVTLSEDLRCTVDELKIQKILAQSCSTLSHVSLQMVKGLTNASLELFTNIALKSLFLPVINTHFDMKLNTSSLLYCDLLEINKEVEHSVLSALTTAPKLHTLVVRYWKNMSVLCQVLPTLPMLHRLDVYKDMIPASLCQVMSTLSQLQRLTVSGWDCEDLSLLCQLPSTLSKLQYIELEHIDLGDNDILLPNSIQEIVLDDVKLTCRSVRQLGRLTQIPHKVTYTFRDCTFRPEEEWDATVKHIQRSHMCEIRMTSTVLDKSVSKI